MNNDNITPMRPSLFRAIRKGFIDAYDHLGYVVFMTFTTFVLTTLIAGLMSFVWRSIGTPNVVKILSMLPAVFIAYLCAVGVNYFAGMSAYRQHPILLDTLDGIRKLIKPALKMFIIDTIITVVLVADFIFFFVMIGSRHTFIFAVPAILIGYATFTWLLMLVYHLPLLASQFLLESNPSVRVILRKSFLLLADNPGFTVGLFLVIIAFAVLCVVPMFIGIAFLFLGASAFLVTHALRELFVKYGIVEQEPEVVEDNWPNK
ncbi:hypothetical protein LLG46_04140 [bacterium]|nr:hypothetical protein [bacterium]